MECIYNCSILYDSASCSFLVAELYNSDKPNILSQFASLKGALDFLSVRTGVLLEGDL